MITVKVNVTQIDKARLFKGEKGTYLDLILIETPNGQYGDFMVKQSVTKEEREAKLQMPILGNAKWLGQKPTQSSPPREAPAPRAAVSQDALSEDVPW